MKLHFTLIAFLLINLASFSQNEHAFVKLTEEKKGKRLTLFATNTDAISYDVFLRVVTTDYRRSSNRPIIKNVPPNSKVSLITLIQLAGSQGNYTPTFIVNEVANTLKVNKDYSNLDFRLDKAIKDTKVTLFTSDDCTICPDAKRVLGDNNINFTEYNIDKDASVYLQNVEASQTDKKPIKSNLPLLKINNNFYKNISSIKAFNEILRKAFN